MPPGVKELLEASGMGLALPEDAATATLRIAADRSIHGKQPSLPPLVLFIGKRITHLF